MTAAGLAIVLGSAAAGYAANGFAGAAISLFIFGIGAVLTGAFPNEGPR